MTLKIDDVSDNLVLFAHSLGLYIADMDAETLDALKRVYRNLNQEPVQIHTIPCLVLRELPYYQG